MLDGDRLFIQCDNEKNSFLIALDKKTGDERWKATRSERSTWSTPLVWRTKQRTEIVTAGSKARSYDPATGKVFWELTLTGGPPQATPVAADDLLIVGTGARRGTSGGRGGNLYAVKAGGSGDITPHSGQSTSPFVAWWHARGGPQSASPLVYQGLVYVLSQTGGLVSCYDLKTGERAYSEERIPGARPFWSSPWAHDGMVFCHDKQGQTFVLRAGREFKVLRMNCIDDSFWSTPAIAGEALLLRSAECLYCIAK